ncbi:hypothetical protein ACFL1V_01435 [Pseudomonadota bacterium]
MIYSAGDLGIQIDYGNDDPRSKWCVDFINGGSNFLYSGNSFSVRLVRGGQ